MIGLHGRGYSLSIWTQTTETPTATRMDPGADGGRIRPGQKLFGRRGAREEEYFHCQSRSHCERIWTLSFKALVAHLSCREPRNAIHSSKPSRPQDSLVPSCSVYKRPKGTYCCVASMWNGRENASREMIHAPNDTPLSGKPALLHSRLKNSSMVRAKSLHKFNEIQISVSFLKA
jgi:hypothetical protein